MAQVTDFNSYEVIEDLSTLQGVSGIYGLSGCYVSQSGNPLYIGSSKDVARRVKGHLRSLQNKKHINPFLQFAWNKHPEDFKVLLFTPCQKSETLAVEQQYLDHWQPFSDLRRGFNISKEASKPPGTAGREFTAEHRRKLSEAAKRRVRKPTSEETRQKISQTKKGHQTSEAARRKMSEKRKLYFAKKGKVDL